MKHAFKMTAAAVALTGTAVLADVQPSEVVFGEYGQIEQSLTGVPGNPENGVVVMTNRGKGNCIACHQVTELMDFPFHGEVGPSLDGVSERWEEADLRGIVANAKMTFPDSVMPAFYKESGFIRPGNAFTGKAGTEPLPTLLTAQEIEDVVAYLMTIKYPD